MFVLSFFLKMGEVKRVLSPSYLCLGIVSCISTKNKNEWKS